MKRPAVVFDLDDTLYPERMFVVGGITAVARLLDGKVPVASGWEPVLLDILEREGPFRLFDSAMAVCGVQPSPELLNELVMAFRSHHPVVRPWPGVVDMLAGLRASGVGLGLVTDGYLDVQRSKWGALGLESMFDAVVFCADVDGVAHPKPDPAGYEKVLGDLACVMGTTPEPVVYVGDNPVKDFPAPDALGWKTVRIRRPGGWHADEPDHAPGRPAAFNTAELRAILDGLLSGQA